MKKNVTNLGINSKDIITSIGKGAAGAIPLAGGFVAELVGTIIPNQRMDRIAKFVVDLNSKVESLPSGILKKLNQDPEFISLLEEAFISAARATTDERRQYILNTLQYGISDEEVTFTDSAYMLRLLNEVNDNEVIWLRYFSERSIHDKKVYQEQHDNIIDTSLLLLGAPEEEKQKAAIRSSYKDHLVRLSLIQEHIAIDHNTKQPEYDTFTGKAKVSYTETTVLGNMLLRNIGLIV